MLRSLSAFVLITAAFLSFVVFSSYSKNSKAENTDPIPVNHDGLPQMIRGISLDKDYNFAGEKLPLENFDVRERLDRELLRNAYYHSSTILALKRSARFFPTIEKILAENEIPDDFKYLAVAESDLSNAVSPAGAKGVWQFMKGTGLEYGLEINADVDERYHLEKSTVAACKYLKKLYEKFGSWTLAAAAYNMGGGKLSQEKTLQRGDSYYDLNLNQETSRYVFRIVAIKEILSNPGHFGFQIAAEEKYLPLSDYTLIEVNESVDNWGDFARKYGTSYRMLKVFNPWMISSSLSNTSRKNYEIRIPRQ